MRLSHTTIQALKDNGFHQKGHAFFRVLGDGVLQVIKVKYERNGNYFDLSVGMFSLYSSLESQWFTAVGCIPRYSVQNVIGQRAGPLLLDPRDKHTQLRSQEAVLLNDGLPWLNSIKTQRDLVDGICYLETSWGGSVNWVDDLKLVPFLLCGDFYSAKKVICSIQEQRKWGYTYKKQILSPSEFQQYLSLNSVSDTRLEYLLQLINTNDTARISEHALSNYSQNVAYAKFCM